MEQEEFEQLTIKEQFQELFRNGIVELDFEKHDGTMRHVRGTLSTEHGMPVMDNDDREDDGKPHRTKNQEQVPYWDLDKEDWRSFNIHQVFENSIQAY